jgi:hypothetical protein
MSKLKMIGGIVLVIVIGVVAMGLISDGEINVIDDIEDEIDLSSEEEQEQTSEPDVETETPVNRYDKIPSSQGKMTPELDYHQPKLHSFLWEDPVILEGGINTAGAEDSPFVSPDGNSFYFFFTPDVSKPAEEQLTDGVTGI